MALCDLQTVIGSYHGLARKALDYTQTTKDLVDASKQRGFSADRWSALAALVDTSKFERIGNFKEVMRWDEYVRFLDGWARTSEWECSFKRVTEHGNVVLLELEERTGAKGVIHAVNSVSVYEFDGDGKIRHLDIYLQMPLPDLDMLKNYDGIAIAE